MYSQPASKSASQSVPAYFLLILSRTHSLIYTSWSSQRFWARHKNSTQHYPTAQ